MPSLYEFCTRYLIQNIDGIEVMGEVPYFLIKPVLERCTPEQLFNIECFNPYLVAETSELWEVHCKRDFRLLSCQENETWRELYLRAHDEQEKQLNSVTGKNTTSMIKMGQDVPSLYELCTHILIENIDEIEVMGEVPYFLLKPVLERCTPVQLFNIECFNPYLLAETSELWEVHCKRDFRLLSRQENETWREFYLRGYDEQEKQLKCVTENNTPFMVEMGQACQVKFLAHDDDTPVTPTQCVLQRQAKHGTTGLVNHTVKPGNSKVSTPKPVSPDIHGSLSNSSASCNIPKTEEGSCYSKCIP